MTLPIRAGIDLGSRRIGVVAGTSLPVIAAAATVIVQPFDDATADSTSSAIAKAVADVLSLMTRAQVTEAAIEHGRLYVPTDANPAAAYAMNLNWNFCQMLAHALVPALRAAGIAVCPWASADGKSGADWWPRAAWASRLLPGQRGVTTEAARDAVLSRLDAASVERLMAAAGDAEERHAARGGGRIATDAIDAAGVMIGSAIVREVKVRKPRKTAARKEPSGPRLTKLERAEMLAAVRLVEREFAIAAGTRKAKGVHRLDTKTAAIHRRGAEYRAEGHDHGRARGGLCGPRCPLYLGPRLRGLPRPGTVPEVWLTRARRSTWTSEDQAAAVAIIAETGDGEMRGVDVP